MKGKRLIWTTLLLAAIAAGCQPREVDPPSPPEEVTPKAFTASLESLEGTASPGWAEDASIKVFMAGSTAGRVFSLSGMTAQGMAQFQSEGFSDYGKAMAAIYPAERECTPGEGGLTVELPRRQRHISGGIDPGLLTFAAVGDSSGRLDFKYLFSLLTVTVESGLKIGSIHLVSNIDEPLWGPLSVALDDRFPTTGMHGNPSPERNSLLLVMDESDGGTEGTEAFVTGPNSTVKDGAIPSNGSGSASTYCFVVPAGSLREGFRLTLIDERGGYMQRDFPAASTIRAQCSKAGELAYREASEEIEIRTDILNKAFYKDIYMNSGLYLTTNDTLPVADFLNLEIEHMMDARNNPTAADYAAQDAVFIGSPEDLNGRLLYPDGAPRYRLFYVRGGSSSSHGLTLGSDGRDRFRAYVAGGGTYLGSCAGAYLATRGTSLDANSAGNYTGIWPGHCNSLTTKQIYPGHAIPPDSPILKYYDFGGDFYIDSVRHHNGPCFINYEYVPGTEVITRFDIPDSTKMHGHPAIITWKKDKWWGRVTPCGSHPEQIPDGENLLLMAAMVRYNFDGVGIARVKGILHNGELRRMTKSTADHDPDYTKIGDRQCHHFVFALPEGARNIRVRLESLAQYQLSLFLAKGTFAFSEDAQYRCEGIQTGKELFFPTLEAGTWYVGVQCESVPTVVTNHGKYGTEYSDTGILNGAPYTVKVSWDY